MRQFQIIVQFFAVLVLLMHSMIPHHHHAELSFTENQQEHLEASSIFDYLALSLHFDHPDGQLEEFTASQSDVSDVDQLDFLGDVPFVIAQAELPLISEENNHSYAYEAHCDRVSTVTHSLRGPPVLL